VQRDWADEFAAGVANINLNTEELTDEQLEAAWAAVGGEQHQCAWLAASLMSST
jgi:hypothetical protein